MKFDEERWRTLAANKPDELHSFIPQSSISELFDEIERLEHEIASLREQVTNLQMSETHKIRVQVVKHMLEQASFICKCFALDVFRNYPRLRDEGLKILDGELDNEEEK